MKKFIYFFTLVLVFSHLFTSCSAEPIEVVYEETQETGQTGQQGGGQDDGDETSHSEGHHYEFEGTVTFDASTGELVFPFVFYEGDTQFTDVALKFQNAQGEDVIPDFTPLQEGSSGEWALPVSFLYLNTERFTGGALTISIWVKEEGANPGNWWYLEEFTINV